MPPNCWTTALSACPYTRAVPALLSSSWPFVGLSVVCPSPSTGEPRTGHSVLQMWPHQHWTDGKDHFPWQAGNILPNANFLKGAWQKDKRQWTEDATHISYIEDYFFSQGGLKTGTGFTQRLWNLPHWRYHKPNRTNPCATCLGWITEDGPGSIG